jgi:hypothetical protein
MEGGHWHFSWEWGEATRGSSVVTQKDEGLKMPAEYRTDPRVREVALMDSCPGEARKEAGMNNELHGAVRTRVVGGSGGRAEVAPGFQGVWP